jgi:ATP-dependent Clp protease protease subunit
MQDGVPVRVRAGEEEDMAEMLKGIGSSLIDRIWETQLDLKQILINEDVGKSLIEKAVIQIFNINMVDDAEEKNNPNYVRAPIKVLINSDGGMVDEAFSLVSAIESSVTTVHTVALGKAYSAGLLILLAGHERYCQKYTMMMLHQMKAGGLDQAEVATILEYSEVWKIQQDIIESWIASKTRITPKKLRDNFSKKHNWYFGAEEALKLGVVHSII